MNEKMFMRGGGFYNATQFILKHYVNITKYNVDIDSDQPQNKIISEDLKRYETYGSTADEIKLRYSTYLDKKCPICLNLLNNINKALFHFKNNNIFDPCLYRILFSHYIMSADDGKTVGDRIKEIGCSKNGYYNALEYATTVFARYLWAFMRKDQASPFYNCDDDTCISMFRCMVISMEMHLPNNYCYVETSELLEKYIKFKCILADNSFTRCNRVSENFRAGLKNESMEWDSRELLKMAEAFRLKKHNYGSIAPENGNSVLLESMGLYIHYLECALEILKNMGTEGGKAYDLLYMSYLDIQFSQLSFSERINMSGYSGKTFYNKRQCAVSELSQILWGPLGHRTFKSYFSSSVTHKSVGICKA